MSPGRRRRQASQTRHRRPRKRPEPLAANVIDGNFGKARVLAETLLSHKPPRDGKPLIAATLVLFFIASYAYWQGAADFLVATPETVFKDHQYWRLLTTIAVHSDIGHWLANTLLFSILGYLLYGYFGLRAFPVAAALGGVVTMGLSLATYGPQTRLVGASGVVYWMAGFWIVLYFALDRRFSVGGRLLRSLGFTLALLAPTSYKPEVSYRTHGIGLVVGMLYGVWFFFRHRAELRGHERYVIDGPSPEPRRQRRRRK